MSAAGFTVILVFSTGHAVKAERCLKTEGITCALVPVPRHLSSDCGVCVRVAQACRERALAVLAERGLVIEGVEDV